MVSLCEYCLGSDSLLRAGQSCSYEYKRQPGSGRTSESCSLSEAIPLELRCLVSGNADFTIQWHYSPSLPAENNTTTTDTDIDNYDQQFNGALRIQQELLNGSGIHKISLLTLTGYDDKTAGYYWCSVNSSSNRTPNPSQVNCT